MVISHRGANKIKPENTIPAFLEAIRLGVDMVEMDVRSTKDGVPVIFHDQDLTRLFNINKRLSELDLKGFKQLFLWTSSSSEREKVFLPTLEEVLSTIPKIPLNLELKDFSEDLSFEEKVIDLIESFGWKSHVWIASKRVRIHEWLKESGSYKRILLQKRRENQETYELLRVLAPDALQIRRQGLVSSFISEVHGLGVKVFYFYADEEAEIKRAVESGVDGILTNYPDRAIEFVRSLRQK